MRRIFQFETPFDPETGLSLNVSQAEYARRLAVHTALCRSAERRLRQMEAALRRAILQSDLTFDVFRARALIKRCQERVQMHAELAIANRPHAELA